MSGQGTEYTAAYLLKAQLRDLQKTALRLIEENAELRKRVHVLTGEPFVFKSGKPTLEEANAMGMPVFERCQKTRFQDCDHCEWFGCGDNQNPNKKSLDASKASTEEWGAQSTSELPLSCCGHTPTQHGTGCDRNGCGCWACVNTHLAYRGLGF